MMATQSSTKLVIRLKNQDRIRGSLLRIPKLALYAEELDEYVLTEIYRLIHVEKFQIVLSLIQHWKGCFPCVLCHHPITEKNEYLGMGHTHHFCQDCASRYQIEVEKQFPHCFRNVDQQSIKNRLICPKCMYDATRNVAWYRNICWQNPTTWDT